MLEISHWCLSSILSALSKIISPDSYLLKKMENGSMKIMLGGWAGERWASSSEGNGCTDFKAPSKEALWATPTFSGSGKLLSASEQFRRRFRYELQRTNENLYHNGTCSQFIMCAVTHCAYTNSWWLLLPKKHFTVSWNIVSFSLSFLNPGSNDI